MLKKIFAVGCLTLAASCSSKPPINNEDRLPAAADFKKAIFTDYESQVLADIFGGDSPIQKYRHEMKVQIYTNKDGKYLSDTAKKAVQQALVASLGGDASEQGLGKAVAGNLKKAMIENFVKTLKVLKLVNTGVQIDLSFLPKANSPGSFAEELSSNQLVLADDTGRLNQKLGALEQNKPTLQIYNNSALIPQGDQKFRYVGGVISIYVEVLDTNPKIKIPNPFRRGVKGFVRYRRYYKTVQDPMAQFFCEKFKVNGKKTAERVPQFFTVDYYKNADLKNLIPTEESLDIFPGRLSASSEGRLELMPDSPSKTGDSISTAVYSIDSRGLAGGTATIALRKLSYSLKDKALSPDNSEAVLVNHDSGASEAGSGGDLVLNNARRTFIKQCGDTFARQLGVSELIQGAGL